MEDEDKTIFKPGQDDDKTVFRPVSPIEKKPEETLYIDLFNADEEIIKSFSLSQNFSVGRALDNTIITDNIAISRHHLEIKNENNEWWVYNQSANGIFIENNAIAQKKKSCDCFR